MCTGLFIAVLALLFTIFSFWWLNWRCGNLVVGEPRSYAAFGSKTGKVLVELPLVFFNGGATPVVVQNLRLRIAGGGSPLAFNAVVDKLGTDADRRFATQFPVRPQEAVNLICEFQRDGGLEFEVRSYEVTLEAVYGRSKDWRTISEFRLNVGAHEVATINKQLIVHDNWSSEDK